MKSPAELVPRRDRALQGRFCLNFEKCMRLASLIIAKWYSNSLDFDSQIFAMLLAMSFIFTKWLASFLRWSPNSIKISSIENYVLTSILGIYISNYSVSVCQTLLLSFYLSLSFAIYLSLSHCLSILLSFSLS